MKDYKEVSKIIFERRDRYIAKQKKRKRLIKSILIPSVLGCFVLVLSISFIKNGGFGDGIKVNGTQNEMPNYEQILPNEDPHNQDSPSNNGGSDSGNSDTPIPENPNKNEENGEHLIDSIDKVNFYSAEKIINENSLLPINSKNGGGYKINLSNNSINYEKEFTITKVTYFNIRLNNEDSFLAKTLGGTGIAEVVVIDTNIEGMDKMITFKKNEQYYTCFVSENTSMKNFSNESDVFSTKRYAEGFDIVSNNSLEQYTFAVHYEGSQVVGFDSTPLKSNTAQSTEEEITFIDDYCVVIFTEETISISQLEVYLKGKTEGEEI